jgi:hypothetical protein
MFKKLLIGGASITASPWLTWADFLEFESSLTTVNLSHKGVGNEFIINSLIKNQDQLGSDSLVVLMLTNIDKWDVYVQDQRFDALQKQKHPPIAIGKKSGFWCTGSWFPDYKKIYQELYYDVDYFCYRTIQMIMLARMICSKYNSHLEIFYDSDIWNYTEQDLNFAITGQILKTRNFLSRNLAKIWTDQLQLSDLRIDKESLIGFCWNNDLAWANTRFKGHPPSSSHWQFYHSVVRPRIAAICDLKDGYQQLLPKIESMDVMWQGS